MACALVLASHMCTFTHPRSKPRLLLGSQPPCNLFYLQHRLTHREPSCSVRKPAQRYLHPLYWGQLPLRRPWSSGADSSSCPWIHVFLLDFIRDTPTRPFLAFLWTEQMPGDMPRPYYVPTIYFTFLAKNISSFGLLRASATISCAREKRRNCYQCLLPRPT